MIISPNHFVLKSYLLRINALLKRTESSDKKDEEKQSNFKIGRYEFDYTNQIITIGDVNQKLSHQRG